MTHIEQLLFSSYDERILLLSRKKLESYNFHQIIVERHWP